MSGSCRINFPSSRLEMAWWVDSLQRLEGIKGMWNKLGEIPKDKQGVLLQLIVGAINSLDDRLSKEEGGKGEKEEKKEEKVKKSITANPDTYQILNSKQGLAQKIKGAIELLEKNRERFKGAAIGSFFGGSGSGTRAAPRIGQIIDLLRELYVKSEGGSKKSGFVVDPAVPDDVNAIASQGDKGVNKVIRLHEDILVNCPEIFDIAVALMHEGSHLIKNNTIDFLYRGGGQHLFLPAEMALLNAANYEEAAVHVIGSQMEEKKVEVEKPEEKKVEEEKPEEKKPEEKKVAEKKPEEKKPEEKKPEEKKPEEKKPEEILPGVAEIPELEEVWQEPKEEKPEEKKVAEKEEVKVLPPTEFMRFVVARVAVQVTRGWVIAQNGSNRALVGEIIDLPTERGAEPLARALLEGFFAGVDKLMQMVQHKIILEQLSGNGDVQVVMPRSKEANTIIRVPEDLAGKRPAVLADAMLREMCKKVVENRWTPL